MLDWLKKLFGSKKEDTSTGSAPGQEEAPMETPSPEMGSTTEETSSREEMNQ